MTKTRRSQACQQLIEDGQANAKAPRAKRVIPFYEVMPVGITSGQVFIYLNLRTKVFSIRCKNLVIAHCHHVTVKDAHFKVSQKTRQRVIDSGRKTVHAGIVGEVIAHAGALDRQAMYNPRKYSHFVDSQTKEPLTDTYEVVSMTKDDQSGWCLVTY